LLNANARPDNKIAVTSNGRINRNNPIPADLIATSSKVSPRLPNVIMDDNKTANGRASGTSVALKYIINLMMMGPSIPLPTKSSIQSQKN
jgi:hypothetical protein